MDKYSIFFTEVLTFSNAFRWKVQLVSPGIEDEFDFRRSVVSINQLSLRKDWIEFHGMKTASSERRYMRSWAAKTGDKKRHLPFKTFVQTFEQTILEELSLTPNQQVKCAANFGSDSVFQRKTFFAWEKWRFSPEEEPDAKSFWVVTTTLKWWRFDDWIELQQRRTFSEIGTSNFEGLSLLLSCCQEDRYERLPTSVSQFDSNKPFFEFSVTRFLAVNRGTFCLYHAFCSSSNEIISHTLALVLKRKKVKWSRQY